MGKASFSYDDPLNRLRANMLSNVHAFSGAKSLHMNAVYTNMLFDDAGNLKPFSKFRNDVQSVNALYNETYLSAEYGQAVASSQMATLWNQYSDDDWLMYSTAGDDRVRDSHRVLDKIVQQRKSNFWKTHWPPNAWNCRCTVVPADKPANPLSEKEAGALGKNSIDGDLFNNNVGESGIIFDEGLPYFKQRKRIRVLDAERNYGLKSADNLLKQEGLPAPLQMDTETDYYAWWQSMIKEHGVNDTDFVLKDKNGISILFDATPDGRQRFDYFKDHILQKREGRQVYASNLVDIITTPDEVWFSNGDYQYMKYYNDGLYVVTVVEKDKVLTAETMYRIDTNKRAAELRKGVLMH
ncbi:MAG TPA: phage minor head protein [Lacibacter sp.]|nr:phage minor head protein [Lacibacter sp.]